MSKLVLSQKTRLPLFLMLLFVVLNVKAEQRTFDIGGETFIYDGLFRLPIKTFGESRVAYAAGPFSVSEKGSSLFVAGHTQHKAIAEFTIPPQKSWTKSVASAPLAKIKQPFVKTLTSGKLKNKEGLDRITGMKEIDGKLIVNAAKYYDANAKNKDTTLVFENANDLKNSKLFGFYRLDHKVHAAGWISAIPSKYTEEFKGTHILGFASNLPINSRSSIGPSAFSADISQLTALDKKKAVKTTRLLDYSLESPLHPDRFNKSGNNDVWTEVSEAVYGFVNEDGEYLVLGHSGGHKSKVGYKIKQSNGKQCGGACAYSSKDYSNYFWKWDLRAASNSPLLAKQPLAYGKLRFKGTGLNTKLIGADYQANTKQLFLLFENADKTQSKYEKAPIIAVFSKVIK